jgi:hypothetical protein
MLNGSRLLFYYPFTALTIVFSHVIANPLLPTARNDIALMDVVTGLFGRLDFVSSGLMACSESGEFTRLARATVDRAISNHKDHLLDGCHNRSHVHLSSNPHASSVSQGSKDSMTEGSTGLRNGSVDASSGSSNFFLENSVESAMPGTDIIPGTGMGFSLSGGNRAIENMLMGFDRANINWCPDMGPDYFQENPSF